MRADPTSILVIEDNRAQQRVMSSALAVRGHRVLIAGSGAAALRMLDVESVDLIILDLGLPDIDGLELFRHIRARVASPVIVVTAESDERRIVEALDLGADDYVIKPFSLAVLLARARVGLRHSLAAAAVLEDRVLEAGDLRLDLAGYQVMAGDTVVDLHPRQFNLLAILMRNQGKVITYAALDRVLGEGEEWSSERNPYRVSISKIRKEIGVGPRRPLIRTEYSVGYRLVVPDHTGATPLVRSRR